MPSHRELEDQIILNLRERVRSRYRRRQGGGDQGLPAEDLRVLQMFRTCPPQLRPQLDLVVGLRNRMEKGKQYEYDEEADALRVKYASNAFLASQPRRVSGSAMGMYLSQLGTVPVLERGEEIQLASVVAEGRPLQQAVAGLARDLGRRPDSVEVALKCGMGVDEARVRLFLYQEAFDLMVQYNVRMVINMAGKLRRIPGVSAEDLVPEGLRGLRLAVAKFDPSKGFKFSTYAHWWIRQSFNKYIADYGRILRLPPHIMELLSKYRKVRAALKERFAGDVPITHVAALLGVNPARLASIVKSAELPRSLDAPLKDSSAKSQAEGERGVSVQEVVTTPTKEEDQDDEDPEIKARRENVSIPRRRLGYPPRSLLCLPLTTLAPLRPAAQGQVPQGPHQRAVQRLPAAAEGAERAEAAVRAQLAVQPRGPGPGRLKVRGDSGEDPPDRGPGLPQAPGARERGLPRRDHGQAHDPPGDGDGPHKGRGRGPRGARRPDPARCRQGHRRPVLGEGHHLFFLFFLFVLLFPPTPFRFCCRPSNTLDGSLKLSDNHPLS